MSFIIKGKEPPICCASCWFFKKKISFPDYSCSCLLGATPPEPWPLRYDRRGDDCPIVEIPAHGRLIDADALEKLGFHAAFAYTGKMPYEYDFALLASVPTVIQAEEAES